MSSSDGSAPKAAAPSSSDGKTKEAVMYKHINTNTRKMFGIFNIPQEPLPQETLNKKDSSTTASAPPSPPPPAAAKEANPSVKYISEVLSNPKLDIFHYVYRRVTYTVILSCATGVTVAYYSDLPMLRTSNTFGYAGFGLSLGFFSTQYALKEVRKKDDVANYIAAGYVTTATLPLLNYGLRAGLLGGMSGAAFGALYKYGGDYLYETGREVWLEDRRYRYHNTRQKRLHTQQFAHIPSDEQLKHHREAERNLFSLKHFLGNNKEAGGDKGEKAVSGGTKKDNE